MNIINYLCILCQMYIHVKAERPNIIFILADDLGWDDVSFHGSQQIPTPNLDALAYDGLLLTNYYVQPICTPTRSALLTGRHPIHTGLQRNTISGAEPYALGLNETIIPQYLKTLGYKTHIVGKWHLGFYAKEFMPTNRGFDTHYGYLTGKEDYWDHTDDEGHDKRNWGLDFRRNMDVVRDAFGQYSTQLFTQEAESIIEKHNTSEPLFMYLAHQGVHSANSWKPLEAPWKYYAKMSHIKDEQRRIFAAMVSAVDESVANVTTALYKKGMLNNTIIVFSTDNGGPAAGYDQNAASNMPLRGMKHTVWEGGVRGAGFVWSPLLPNSGIIFKHMIQVIDWLPTLLSAAGYNMTSLPTSVDGIDQWGELVNRTQEKGIRTEMLHNIDSQSGEYALRINEWKLIFSKDGQSNEHDQWYPQMESRVADANIFEANHVLVDKIQERVSYFNLSMFEESVQSNGRVQFDQLKIRNTSNEIAAEELFKSSIDDVLKRLGRNGTKGTAFIVDCGPRPENYTSNCDVSKAPCLFNVKHDPCEYLNRAGELPQYVEQMLKRVAMYNATAVPPKNKAIDRKGFPSNNGGVWGPWVTLHD